MICRQKIVFFVAFLSMVRYILTLSSSGSKVGLLHHPGTDGWLFTEISSWEIARKSNIIHTLALQMTYRTVVVREYLTYKHNQIKVVHPLSKFQSRTSGQLTSKCENAAFGHAVMLQCTASIH